MHYFTTEQKEFVLKNIKGKKSKDLLEMFNDHFDTEIKINQLRAFIKNNGFKSGLDARFKKGQKSWNKGMKGVSFGGKETQFKKGNRPHNYMPVGTERVNGDDYVDIKIADPNKWRGKHILIWEEANGPVPKGHAVIFGDGNRRNFDLNNLILVSRAQLAVMNRRSLIRDDAELTKTGVIIADLHMRIGKRRKDAK